MSQARLQQIIALTRQHDPDLAAWLRDAVAEWKEGADLAGALELTGGRAVAQRNAALREAGRLLSDDGAGPWAAAGRLAAAIVRFETRVMPRLDSNDLPLSSVDAALRRAFAATANGRMIRAQRKLYELLRDH